jgi:hypothetical protein
VICRDSKIVRLSHWPKACRRHHFQGKRHGYGALPFSLRRGTHYDFYIAAKKRQAVAGLIQGGGIWAHSIK